MNNNNNKELTMNKLKLVGVSALCGSLASFSAANAGDLSASGSVHMTWISLDDETVGNPIGINSGVSFSGSGELDNGWTVSTTHATSGAFALTSSNISVDTGSMGKVRFNRIAAASANANDDVLPTAWEEANDNADTSIRGTALADNMSSGSISYISPTIDLAGGSVSFTLDYDPAASSGGGNPGATIARTANTGNGAHGVSVDGATSNTNSGDGGSGIVVIRYRTGET